MSPEVAEKLLNLLNFTSLILLAVVWCVLGASVTAASLAYRGVWPEKGERLDILALGQSGWRRVLLGVLNLPTLLLFSLLGFRTIKLVGLAFLLVLLYLAFIGLTAEFTQLGRRVLALRGEQSHVFAQIVCGGTILTLVTLFPVAGQLIFLYIAFRSVGTGVLWLFSRKLEILPRDSYGAQAQH